MEPNRWLLRQWVISHHSQQHEIYFITNRMGQYPKRQTELWLSQHLGFSPTVLISPHKGQVCAALHLDYYVDDKPSNVDDVIAEAPNTTVFMQDRAYNRSSTDLDHCRITSLAPLLALLV